MRRLILAKDVALGVTLASGLAAQVVGRKRRTSSRSR